ncbi:MAG: hypothetical protein ACTHNG_00355 [Ginsengibacter sp.]|jgi:hypothetical protein|nr:hypothetical protein [Hanamia sp.]
MSKEEQNKEHKGRPGGTNKSEGTGLSSTMQNQDVKEDQKITEKYMKGTDEVADNVVHKKHPNRNTDKDEPIDGSGFQD